MTYEASLSSSPPPQRQEIFDSSHTFDMEGIIPQNENRRLPTYLILKTKNIDILFRGTHQKSSQPTVLQTGDSIIHDTLSVLK